MVKNYLKIRVTVIGEGLFVNQRTNWRYNCYWDAVYWLEGFSSTFVDLL